MGPASHYAQAPAAGDAALPTTQARYGYDGLGRRVWKQVEHQGQSPELTVFTWDGDLLQSEESFQGKPPTAFPAEPLELARENPERRLSVPVAQRVHSLDTVAMAPQRRVSYLFEPGSFIPAAKLEAHYEVIPQVTGSGTVLYSGYRLAEPKLYYFQTDHLGTPLEVTDTNGDLAWVGHY
ncbi:RHS domain-containing protein, partial [Halomonas cupida]